MLAQAKAKDKPGLQAHARRVFGILAKTYPSAHCELNFENPFQLLVATILSAQCTDRNVNKVTGGLFQHYATPEALAKAKPSAVEKLIRSIGLYRNKTKSIIACSQMLVEKFGGRVPQTMEDLVQLPGVGRKTANVVLFNAFQTPGIAVDTHVLRVGKRLGLFQTQDPVKVEQQLENLMPPKDWGNISHWLIWHGRRVCFARNPNCPGCPLNQVCPSAFKAH